MRLSLAARESFFVLLTDTAENLPLLNKKTPIKTEAIEGPWDVYFDKKMGGPGKVIFPKLTDWTQNSDPGIKYYSGTAIYKKEIFLKPKRQKITIDLDNPGFVAKVLVNGKDAGIVWCSPWKLDITPFLKNGKNNLEIHVANSLMNRMIYDSQLLEKDRITFSYPSIVEPSDKLENSGLINVKLEIERM